MQIIWEIFILFFQLVYHYFKAISTLVMPQKLKSMKNKIVLITGGGHGIGRALAVEFSKRGAIVVVWDINEKSNNETAEIIKQHGGAAFSYRCDVTKTADVKLAASKVKHNVGRVHTLVNNAGILNGAEMLKLREEDIVRTFHINSIAHFWTVREFLPAMLDENEGHIVTIASIAGFFGTRFNADYCASKFAAIGFHESLTEEIDAYGKAGVKTSVVAPTFVDTGLAKYPEQRFGKVLFSPEEVASTVVNGVLRNKLTIFVPGRLWFLVTFDGFLPYKCRQLIAKFWKMWLAPQYDETSKKIVGVETPSKDATEQEVSECNNRPDFI